MPVELSTFETKLLQIHSELISLILNTTSRDENKLIAHSLHTWQQMFDEISKSHASPDHPTSTQNDNH